MFGAYISKMTFLMNYTHYGMWTQAHKHTHFMHGMWTQIHVHCCVCISATNTAIWLKIICIWHEYLKFTLKWIWNGECKELKCYTCDYFILFFSGGGLGIFGKQNQGNCNFGCLHEMNFKILNHVYYTQNRWKHQIFIHFPLSFSHRALK